LGAAPGKVDFHQMHQQNPGWAAGTAAYNAANPPLIAKNVGNRAARATGMGGGINLDKALASSVSTFPEDDDSIA
jgi:hypothetical protein